MAGRDLTWPCVGGARTASMAKVDLVNMSKGQATKLATSMASCSELVSLRPLKAAWREAAAMTDLGARMKAYSVAAKVAMVVACLVRVARRWEGKEERQVSLGSSWLRKLRVVGTPSCHLKEESTCISQCRSSCRLMEWSVYKTSCNPEMGATATYLEASRRQEAAANWNWDFLIVVLERKVSR